MGMNAPNQSLPVSDRTRVRRHAERARTDRADLYAVLDAGMICHLGVVMDGVPAVLPTAYGRIGDTLYVHGSSANRSMHAADGAQVCVTVTHLDGLVCARAVFSHSVNYRSAMVYGTARLVTGDEERLAGLRAVTEQLVPGRWDTIRAPNRKELAKTAVLAVPLHEASVKIRTGPPIDTPEDLGTGLWAGVIPVMSMLGAPELSPSVSPGTPVPDHIRALVGQLAGAPGLG
jgi:uncharacterized protein